MNALLIQNQIDQNRRSVGFDSYDLSVRQLLDMIAQEEIDIAPEYQRHFIWNEDRQSQLIESVILGIPIPSLFMATNTDSNWEVIDGLQRLTTLVNFISDEELILRVNQRGRKLRLTNLDKLDSLNGLVFEELPLSIQRLVLTRPIRVTVLNDRSDFGVRYDLFERLNTGGVMLHPQEIRNCIYLGEFREFLSQCSQNPDFQAVVKVANNPEKSANREELVLKFFAYFEDRNLFVHSVKDFLNAYMQRKTSVFDNALELRSLFENTFQVLNECLPNGIVRSNRLNTTPLILFEAISVGIADIINRGERDSINPQRLQGALDNRELNRLTTGATNSRNKLLQRIAFVTNFVSQ